MRADFGLWISDCGLPAFGIRHSSLIRPSAFGIRHFAAACFLAILAGPAAAATLMTAGTTSHTEYVFIQDSSKSTGAGLSGLAYNSSGLTCYYVRTRGSETSVTLASVTETGAWSSGGFAECNTNGKMPGTYRLDVPDAVFATGATRAVLYLQGATNMAPVVLEYQLCALDINTALSSQSVSSVSGSVGSVTGDVGGNVKGNVNGNVAGTVAGVTPYSGTPPTAGQIAAAITSDGKTIDQTKIANLDATISSRLAAAGYTAPPSTSSIASTVWGLDVSAYTTAGQAGTCLRSAGSAGDPWASAVATYGAGTFGNVIQSISSHTALLTAPATLTVSNPVATGGAVSIFRGDDYSAADGRALAFTLAGYSGPSLAGAATSLYLIPRADWERGTGRATLAAAASVAGTTTLTLSVALTAAQTASLAANPTQQYTYIYQIRSVTAAGRTVTLATGTLTVTPNIKP